MDILYVLYHSVLNVNPRNPEMNDREKLLNLAKNLFDRYKIS